jgi:transposase
MDNLSQVRIIGIDVSRDHLDAFSLPDRQAFRLPNTPEGHKRLLEKVPSASVVVCFEATGGQEWRLWAALDAAGIEARQLPPAQVGAFAASCGSRAKTDRIDAKLISRLMAFRPDAGRTLPAQKLRLLRALTSKRAQLVETRKRLAAQVKAQQKQGMHAPLEELDEALRSLLDSQIAELESRIEHLIAADDTLARTVQILRSIPGIGPVASTMLIAEMPELGQISGEKAAALTGLAPIAHDSGTLRGKRAIGGGRRSLRHVMFQAALVASYHNPVLKAFADRLRKAGKPHKVIVTAVARKLVTIANALCRSDQSWTDQPA